MWSRISNRPISAHQRCKNAAPSFSKENGPTANVYNYCLIIIENSDEDLQVTFYLTDAHEMNWITEFLDARFYAIGDGEPFQPD